MTFNSSNIIAIIILLLIGLIIGLSLRTNNNYWSNEFSVVKIISNKDKSLQKAYFYKTSSDKPKPLVVSLHTWSGKYDIYDGLANLCLQKDINYIHPDFRGVNSTIESCCSNLALSDIDDAITYAIKNSNVDTEKIYVIGASGGGYAALSTFMKSNHNINTISAWVPITDLVAWHHESSIRKLKFTNDILKCTNSKNNVLNIENAKDRSPIYWQTPIDKLMHTKVNIYTGIYDGIQGSVPITHSINFYNKLLTDLSVKDSTKYVSKIETQRLLKQRKPLGEFGVISGRKVFLNKEFNTVKLVIFDGGHEILTEYAIDELLKN